MWNSLKEQIEEAGSAKLTGSDASDYIKDNAVIFVYEGHKIKIPISDDSPLTLYHIGNGTVKLQYKLLEILAKIDAA